MEAHPTGNFIFKEFKLPWLHWHGPPAIIDQLDLAEGDERASHPWFSDKTGAYVLEDSVAKPAIKRWNRRRLAQVLDAGTASDVVQIIERIVGSPKPRRATVNLISSRDSNEEVKTIERVCLPVTFFVDFDTLTEVLGLPGPQAQFTVPGSHYRDALTQFEVVVRNHDEGRPLENEEPFERSGDTHFVFVVPERPFEDTDFARQLVKPETGSGEPALALISERLLGCLRWSTFPPPSSRRGARSCSSTCARSSATSRCRPIAGRGSQKEQVTRQRGLEASIAQGFKVAARLDRRLGVDEHVRARLERNDTFWYSQLNLLHAVTLRGVHTEDGNELQKYLRRFETDEKGHPFVRATAWLCRLAIGDAHMGTGVGNMDVCVDRYVWDDEGKVVSRRPNQLAPEAVQLVGDITVLLNMNELGDEQGREMFGKVFELPHCMQHGRSSDEFFTKCVGDPDCVFHLCPIRRAPDRLSAHRESAARSAATSAGTQVDVWPSIGVRR